MTIASRPAARDHSGADELGRHADPLLEAPPGRPLSGESATAGVGIDSTGTSAAAPYGGNGEGPRMTDTTETVPASAGGRKTGLNAMLLPELKRLAGGLGIKATGMRKGDLVEAIRSAQGGASSGPANGPGAERRQRRRQRGGRTAAARTSAPRRGPAPSDPPPRRRPVRRASSRPRQARRQHRLQRHRLRGPGRPQRPQPLASSRGGRAGRGRHGHHRAARA